MNVNFIQAIKKFYTNYVNFSGRATRAEFWFAVLYQFILGFIFFIIPMLLILTVAIANTPSYYFNHFDRALDHMFDHISPLMFLLLIPGVIIYLANLIPGIAICFRRLHDSGHSGWWYGASMILNALSPLFQLLVILAEPGVNAAIFIMAMTSIFNLANFALGVVILVFTLQGSKPDNEYGPDPYGNKF